MIGTISTRQGDRFTYSLPFQIEARKKKKAEKD
jgi:hypothetical protein